MSVDKEIEELINRLTKENRDDLLNSLRARYQREQEDLVSIFKADVIKFLEKETKR